MLKDKDEIFRLSDNLCSMVFSDLQKFVHVLLIDGGLTKKELAELLGINVGEIYKILQDDFSNVALKTYLRVLVASELTLDVHSLKAPYYHSRGKSKYDNIENGLNERQKKELAKLLGISVVDVDKFLYVNSSDKIKYDNIENELYEKKNAFLDALKECKPDSKYLQQLRELAKANAGNEKLCELIRYYTE